MKGCGRLNPITGGPHRRHTEPTTAEAGCYQYESDADGVLKLGGEPNGSRIWLTLTLIKAVAQLVKG